MKRTGRALRIVFCLMLLAMAGTQTASAKTIVVKFIGGFQKAVNEAEAGDTVLVTNGMYTTGTDILVTKAGTAEKPIIIMAQTAGQVELTGLGGISLASGAKYVIVSGFKFTHSSSRARSTAGTSFCRWTRNIFENEGAGEDLTIAGSDHEIDHNTFSNKKAMGRFLAIRGEGKQIAERLWIHHNYFYNFEFQGGANGAEAFQFGLSGFSMSKSNSIVEYNLFEECHGENELISVKASGVTLRYNTIRNSKAQFTLRHGNFCEVYGNYFHNTPGLRIFGDDHLVYSNYFEVCSTGINIGNGDGEVADGAALTCHDRPDRVLIAFNTLSNCKSNITMSTRDKGMGATKITVAHNIVKGGGPAAVIAGPYTDAVWAGNFIFNTESKGDMPDATFTSVDPKLGRDASQAIRLLKGSPAIDAVPAPKGKKAQDPYSMIKVDMDGQPRKSPLDAGADEFSTEPAKARLLNPVDVGVEGKL
jgi:poly(beta-D-mannuronate) lyase